jgi:hypothetical protein
LSIYPKLSALEQQNFEIPKKMFRLIVHNPTKSWIFNLNFFRK